MISKSLLSKIYVKKFKILLKLNNSETFLSTETISSIMSQSRVLEPELVDDYLVDLFNNLYLDFIADSNDSTLNLKLPLLLYFFKKNKTVLHIKTITINDLLHVHYEKLTTLRSEWLLRLRFFSLNNYLPIKHIKSLAFSNKKKSPLESRTNFKYMLSTFENFRILVLKSSPNVFSYFSYNYLHDSSIAFRGIFYSHLDKEFMRNRKVNFRRKNKKG